MQNYEINDSYRSSYTPLDKTWCGKGIPKKPFDTFNPPFHYNKKCPADWLTNNIAQVPDQNIQIVYETSNYGYNALTHDSPLSTSGYFSFLSAYNNDKNGYEPVFRKCDGSFVKLPTKPPLSSISVLKR
jgi:hypothetical protein